MVGVLAFSGLAVMPTTSWATTTLSSNSTGTPVTSGTNPSSWTAVGLNGGAVGTNTTYAYSTGPHSHAGIVDDGGEPVPYLAQRLLDACFIGHVEHDGLEGPRRRGREAPAVLVAPHSGKDVPTEFGEHLLRRVPLGGQYVVAGSPGTATDRGVSPSTGGYG
jgi:hypothetical protein